MKGRGPRRGGCGNGDRARCGHVRTLGLTARALSVSVVRWLGLSGPVVTLSGPVVTLSEPVYPWRSEPVPAGPVSPRRRRAARRAARRCAVAGPCAASPRRSEHHRPCELRPCDHREVRRTAAPTGAGEIMKSSSSARPWVGRVDIVAHTSPLQPNFCQTCSARVQTAPRWPLRTCHIRGRIPIRSATEILRRLCTRTHGYITATSSHSWRCTTSQLATTKPSRRVAYGHAHARQSLHMHIRTIKYSAALLRHSRLHMYAYV